MTGNKIVSVSGKAIAIVGDDIDTDRIIPARFLKEITFSNLGKFPFHDERFNADMSSKNHPFNDPRHQGAAVLFVNKNFGCGSSREHAPQALRRWGIKAIVGESFAEIFASNCITLGLPAVTASADDINRIQQSINDDPITEWTVDLDNSSVSSSDHIASIYMPEHHKNTLKEGLWDSTDLLLQNMDEVARLYDYLPYVNNYGA